MDVGEASSFSTKTDRRMDRRRLFRARFPVYPATVRSSFFFLRIRFVRPLTPTRNTTAVGGGGRTLRSVPFAQRRRPFCPARRRGSRRCSPVRCCAEPPRTGTLLFAWGLSGRHHHVGWEGGPIASSSGLTVIDLHGSG